jgi:hypothetical protein
VPFQKPAPKQAAAVEQAQEKGVAVDQPEEEVKMAHLDSTVVKSRMRIGQPSRKRPPSKVVSLAFLRGKSAFLKRFELVLNDF